MWARVSETVESNKPCHCKLVSQWFAIVITDMGDMETELAITCNQVSLSVVTLGHQPSYKTLDIQSFLLAIHAGEMVTQNCGRGQPMNNKFLPNNNLYLGTTLYFNIDLGGILHREN